jgi:16S rRNA C1402 (ribose-2'-O) methylase RsmI
MNRALALHLIAPFEVGSAVTPHARLTDLAIHQDEYDYRKDQIHLSFSTGLVLIIVKRRGLKSAFNTSHYAVSIQSSETPLSDENTDAMNAIRARLEANERDHPNGWIEELVHTKERMKSAASLWLIPGHLGNPLDLTIRALRILKSVDLIWVESGCESATHSIYDLFELGETPRIVAIPEDEESIKSILESAIDEGHIMALFGSNEGLPGVCDPGWRVVKAAAGILPKPSIRTASGGSALTTALMYNDDPRGDFVFTDLFMNEDGHSSFLNSLFRNLPWSTYKTFICFIEGEQLLQNWDSMSSAAWGLCGQLTLIANVSRPNEYVHQISLMALPSSIDDSVDPKDKLVLRIDVDHSRTGWRTIPRLVRRLLIPWKYSI